MKRHLSTSGIISTGTSLLAIAALSGACATEPRAEAVAVDQSFQAQMIADSKYMRSLFAPRDGSTESSHRIDLADPGQQRFVMNRLAAAGKNAHNSPYLFERLEVLKTKAIARKHTSAAAELTVTDFCDSFIVLGTQVKNGTTTTFVDTRPEVTCVGGASYVYADIATYNANLAGTEAFFVAGAAGEDFSGGTNFGSVLISPTLPAQAGRINQTDSMVMASNDLGDEQLTFNLTETALEPAQPSITVVHPVFHDWINNGGFIEMCQLRGHPTQCDYGVGSLNAVGTFTGWTPNASGVYTGISAVRAGTGTGTVAWQGDPSAYFSFPTAYQPTHVYLPMQGTMDAGTTATGTLCLIKSVDEAKFRLTKTTTGGTCTTSTTFKSAFAAVPGTLRTVNFRGISDFLNNGTVPGDCSITEIIRNQAVRPLMTIKVTANCGAGNITITTSKGPTSLAIPQQIKFLNSCFAEGTKIRRADGSTTTIEGIKVGDKVISDSKGTILTVTGTSHGIEIEPLVELRDNKGHKLRLTSTHPIIKASGEVALASAIEKDDQVMTDRGIARITAVARIPYDGQVYNVKVGTDEEQARVGKRGTTMFAGGFLVGDSAMQREAAVPRQSVAQRSKAWQRDYENALANNPAMIRVLR
jgi:hypothetical protein